MGSWDATSYEGKDTIMRVVNEEADRFFSLAGRPGVWDSSTPCPQWAVGDIVGHIVDTTEGYFAAFDAARSHSDPGAPLGLPMMHEVAGERATTFRNVPQEALLARLRTDLDKMNGLLRAVGPDDWGGLIVSHAYMGPVPAFFYSAGQLMDYAVHSWDIAEASGRCHAMSGEAADLLVPFMFVLWQGTIREDADKSPMQLGVRVTSGHNAGDTRLSITPEGMTFEAGDVSDLPCVLEFDAASLVLTTFGRCNTGTVRGDAAIADRFLNLFFRI